MKQVNCPQRDAIKHRAAFDPQWVDGGSSHPGAGAFTYVSAPAAQITAKQRDKIRYATHELQHISDRASGWNAHASLSGAEAGAVAFCRLREPV